MFPVLQVGLLVSLHILCFYYWSLNGRKVRLGHSKRSGFHGRQFEGIRVSQSLVWLFGRLLLLRVVFLDHEVSGCELGAREGRAQVEEALHHDVGWRPCATGGFPQLSLDGDAVLYQMRASGLVPVYLVVGSHAGGFLGQLDGGVGLSVVAAVALFVRFLRRAFVEVEGGLFLVGRLEAEVKLKRLFFVVL